MRSPYDGRSAEGYDRRVEPEPESRSSGFTSTGQPCCNEAMIATRPARPTTPRAASAATRRLFTRDEYQAMGRAGILGEDERVELIRGEIIVMAAIANRHAACVLRLTNTLTAARLEGRALVQVQNPVAADTYSEPQPDLMLLAHRDDYYDFGHPSPSDVLLLVEVAASSLDYDRHTKVPFYALSGIREVWIVDLEADRIEAYADPEAGSYRTMRRYVPGETIAPSVLPDLELAVAALIPGRRPADAAR